MKIIDLLNKIANGEIDRNNKYQFSKDDYCTINDFFARYIVDEENLNLKIEEEKKIPEKLYTYRSYTDFIYHDEKKDDKERFFKDLQNTFVDIEEKINEIIDYLQSKGE